MLHITYPMELSFKSMPPCILHNQPITHLCASPDCKIPNPMVCANPKCFNSHSHPIHQMISLDNLSQLLHQRTASMNLLIKKSREYYAELRQTICHEIEKKEELMCQALEYKYTHPVVKKLRSENYAELSPLKIWQMISYMKGTVEERNTMESIKNDIYKEMQRIETNVNSLFEGIEFKKCLLFHLVDLSSINPTVKINELNVNILKSEDELQIIREMLKDKYPKAITSWELLYRGSQNNFLAQKYREAIQGKGPLLMLFETDKFRKFGCFINSRVNKKEGWIADATGHSFIFSLNHIKLYPIKQEAKHRVKALMMGDKGPQIGSGLDIYISDRCHFNEESGANLGGSFDIPANLFFGSSQAKSHLAGEEKFLIREYEVYQLS